MTTMSDAKHIQTAIELLGSHKTFSLKRMSKAQWREFFAFCQREGVSLHLSKNLSALKRAGCPPEIQQTVQFETLIAKSNHEKKLNRLLRIEACARAAKIPLLPLKGCLYYRLNLEHAPFRVMSDIDLLVPLSSVEALVRKLGELGIERPLDVNRHRYHAELRNKWSPFATSPQGRDLLTDGTALVDVHWEPLYYLDGSPVKLEVSFAWKSFEASLDLSAVPRAFFLTHTLVHCIHAASEPNGLTLSRIWDLRKAIQFAGCTLEAIRPYWRSQNENDENKIVTLMEAFWSAAVQLGKKDSASFLKLRQQSFQVPPVEDNRSPHLLRQVKGAKDRVKLIAGYFLKS